MLTGTGKTITWDVENKPITIVKDGITTIFVYDRDANRVKKTVGGVTTTYVNQYYEKTGTEVTTYYYLAARYKWLNWWLLFRWQSLIPAAIRENSAAI